METSQKNALKWKREVLVAALQSNKAEELEKNIMPVLLKKIFDDGDRDEFENVRNCIFTQKLFFKIYFMWMTHGIVYPLKMERLLNYIYYLQKRTGPLRVEYVLDRLPQSGPEAFDTFCFALACHGHFEKLAANLKMAEGIYLLQIQLL